MAVIKMDLWLDIPDEMALDFKEAELSKRTKMLVALLESGRHLSLSEPIILLDEDSSLGT